jgi:hypothetical protein
MPIYRGLRRLLEVPCRKKEEVETTLPQVSAQHNTSPTHSLTTTDSISRRYELRAICPRSQVPEDEVINVVAIAQDKSGGTTSPKDKSPDKGSRLKDIPWKKGNRKKNCQTWMTKMINILLQEWFGNYAMETGMDKKQTPWASRYTTSYPTNDPTVSH